jgi:hypothetical protein
MPPSLFLGIDVQGVRNCPYAVLDAAGHPVESDWLGTADPPTTAREAVAAIARLSAADATRIAVGIDAPRAALSRPRQVYWEGRARRWRGTRPKDKGLGRHAEVVIAAYSLANPQWTPLASAAPSWMRYGFALFEALASFPHVFEVFPSAAYTQLARSPEATLTVGLQHFFMGPKDMLDAHMAAWTVMELLQGRGTEVGGGDGLGTIALPRALGPGPAAVLTWPDAKTLV